MNLDEIQDEIRTRGYYLHSRFPAEELLPLAYALGIPVPNKRDRTLIKEIRPELLKDANPNTLSSRYGLSGFPFHSETAFRREPIRYLILFCENPGSGGRPTQLLDFFERPFSEHELRVLRSEVWKVTQILRPFLTTILTEHPVGSFVRFDRDCMLPASPGRSAATGIVRERVATGEHVDVAWASQDVLVVDNFRMLHARGTSDILDRDRVLKRLLVAA